MTLKCDLESAHLSHWLCTHLTEKNICVKFNENHSKGSEIYGVDTN